MATVTKCDVCDKNIKLQSSLGLRLGYKHNDICLGCGKALIEFAASNKLSTKNELTELQTR